MVPNELGGHLMGRNGAGVWVGALEEWGPGAWHVGWHNGRPPGEGDAVVAVVGQQPVGGHEMGSLLPGSGMFGVLWEWMGDVGCGCGVWVGLLVGWEQGRQMGVALLVVVAR